MQQPQGHCAIVYTNPDTRTQMLKEVCCMRAVLPKNTYIFTDNAAKYNYLIPATNIYRNNCIEDVITLHDKLDKLLKSYTWNPQIHIIFDNCDEFISDSNALLSDIDRTTLNTYIFQLFDLGADLNINVTYSITAEHEVTCRPFNQIKFLTQTLYIHPECYPVYSLIRNRDTEFKKICRLLSVNKYAYCEWRNHELLVVEHKPYRNIVARQLWKYFIARCGHKFESALRITLRTQKYRVELTSAGQKN